MKIAPLFHELNKRDGFEPIIVHTGLHYDLNMSDVFFQELNLPEPHIHLNIGSGTHAFQTSNVMIVYEKVLLKDRPDLTKIQTKKQQKIWHPHKIDYLFLTHAHIDHIGRVPDLIDGGMGTRLYDLDIMKPGQSLFDVTCAELSDTAS